MFYTHYRGQTCGRMLGYIELCCSLTVAEWATVGDGQMTYEGKPLGTYKWKDNTDIAIIDFIDDRHKRNYLIKGPFIDDQILSFSVSYAVQEMTRYIKNSLGSDELIKEQLLTWWYPANKEQINQHYDLLKTVVNRLINND